MGMRRSLVRIWVGTTGLLLFFLGLTIFPEIHRAQRFESAQAALASLSPIERLQVLDRIAWLNGEPVMPSVPPVSVSDSSRQFRNGIDIANARLAAARPLPRDLEDLARNANVTPKWAVVRWRIGFFVVAITVLWALLYLGFWFTAPHRDQPIRPLARTTSPAVRSRL
jgi:hypothetical protein